MTNTRNFFEFVDIGDSARRQYINALSVFSALEEARKKMAQFRGGMYWKTHSTSGIDYLVRTQTNNSQRIIGSRSMETEAAFHKFTTAKAEIESRVRDLKEELQRSKRLNRALFVGRAPRMLVDVLNMFAENGISEHFRVIGTNSLYAYEAAAGVRIEKEAALETNDIDLLWNIDKKLRFQTQLKYNELTMIKLLKKVDKTFELREYQRYTAVNSKGYEIDIVRRKTSHEGPDAEPNPSRMTECEDDFLATKAESANMLQGEPLFTSVIASASGDMARINTISPLAFIKVKKWLSIHPDREPLKRQRDILQAELVEKLMKEYLPGMVIKSHQTDSFV